LQRLGLAHATDLGGGFAAWAAPELPVTLGRSEQAKQLRDETAGGQPVSLAAHDGPVPAASPPGLCESTPWVDAAPLRQVFTSVLDLTLSR